MEWKLDLSRVIPEEKHTHGRWRTAGGPRLKGGDVTNEHSIHQRRTEPPPPRESHHHANQHITWVRPPTDEQVENNGPNLKQPTSKTDYSYPNKCATLHSHHHKKANIEMNLETKLQGWKLDKSPKIASKLQSNTVAFFFCTQRVKKKERENFLPLNKIPHLQQTTT